MFLLKAWEKWRGGILKTLHVIEKYFIDNFELKKRFF